MLVKWTKELHPGAVHGMQAELAGEAVFSFLLSSRLDDELALLFKVSLKVGAENWRLKSRLRRMADTLLASIVEMISSWSESNAEKSSFSADLAAMPTWLDFMVAELLEASLSETETILSILLVKLIKGHLKSQTEVWWGFEYSGHPKTEHWKTGIIRQPDILEVGFRIIQTIWNPDHSKWGLA